MSKTTGRILVLSNDGVEGQRLVDALAQADVIPPQLWVVDGPDWADLGLSDIGLESLVLSMDPSVAQEDSKPTLEEAQGDDLKGLMSNVVRWHRLQANLKKTEQELHLLESAVQQARDAVIILTAPDEKTEPKVVYANEGFFVLTGYNKRESIDRPLAELEGYGPNTTAHKRLFACLKKGQAFEGELETCRKDGTQYLAELYVAPIHTEEGRVSHYVAVQRDITEQKRLQERLQYLAHHDHLTGLPNRKLFQDRLEQAVRRANRNKEFVGLLFVDLDRFKAINDTLGHAMGDHVLRTVANRLTELVRASDTVARLGGDEFTVILPGLADAEDASFVADKLLKKVSDVMAIEGQELFVTPSVGVAIYPRDGEDADILIRRADNAMYRAKELGKANVQIYSMELDAEEQETLALEEALVDAFTNDEFALHYQPIIDVTTGSVKGAEALLRWHNKDRGMVSPAQFLPIMKKLDLTTRVGSWVIRTACEAVKKWNEGRVEPLRVGVNLSRKEFHHPGLMALLERVIEETGVEKDWLELEITEGTVLEQTEVTMNRLRELRGYGVRVCIDDFGTGHLPLHHLGLSPVDTVKIDGSLVRRIGDDPDAVLRAMVSVGHSLDLEVIAVGVETEEQRIVLSDLGCDRLQGYLFDRPLGFDEFCKGLNRGSGSEE